MRHASPTSQDRERFLEGTAEVPRVRPEIAASWRRSALSGVQADCFPAVPFEEPRDDTVRLLRAAGPVLDRLAEELSGTVTTIIISDAQARILARRDGDSDLRSSLERVRAVPGSCYGEEVVGTNGLGTVIESRRPTVVAGSEHFHEMLTGFTCVGAPLVHPMTRRLEGVLDLTCRHEDTNQLMLPMVLEAAREITHRLYDATSSAEQILLEHFLAVARRSSRPVVALNQYIIITNAAAGRLLEPADHALLWESAARAIGDGACSEELVLGRGVVARASVRPIGAGGDVVGSLIELDLPADGPRDRLNRRRRDPGLPGLVGRTAEWHLVCMTARGHAGTPVGVAVTGPPGAGKLAVAKALHSLACLPGEPLLLDAALVLIDGEPGWLGRFRAALGAPGTVVVRHIDLLPARMALAVANLLDSADGACRTMATAEPGWADEAPRALVDRFPARIEIPPLAIRAADIPALLNAFSVRHGAAGVRWTAAAIQALSRHPWPGNVRELESLVRRVIAWRPAGDIGPHDLPPEHRSARAHRTLARLEQVECDAIVHALEAAGGNKHEAAVTLGISRSTLYRKIAAYGIALERTAY